MQFFFGANKVHYGKLGSGVYYIFFKKASKISKHTIFLLTAYHRIKVLNICRSP